MPLSAGTPLGPYEIVAPIGKGGMGEVYRAHDKRLRRDVAIKVSTERFSERFEKEARAIASLNHPNVCTLHDIGPNYLVMELVEGQTLSDRIREGTIPLEHALSIARQIAAALQAAHDKGITHRDLKPGNIMIKSDGTVKVLDFGLAKTGGTPAAQSDNSPTLTLDATQAGVILGTAAYMSPEQARGKEVDRRADIWAFGVVLYEMLTAEKLFQGEDLSDTLASVIKQEPKLDRAPAEVQRLLRSCFKKDPAERLQAIGDWRLLLDESPTSSSATSPAKARWLWPSLAVGALVIMAAITAWALWLRPAPPTRATRFQVTLPENVTFSEYVSVSPDGRKLLFNATGAQSGLWIHDLDTLEWRKLAGTEEAVSPFWSPDSRFLGFGVGNELKKIEVAGGPSQTLCTIPEPVGTGTWDSDGVILFGTYKATGPIRRVSSAGGVPAAVTQLDPGVRTHWLPSFLPDGKHFLYLRVGSPETTGIYAGALDVKPAEQSKQRILATSFAVTYAGGNLLFMRDGTLMMQPFDTGKLELRGEPVPVAEHVATAGATGIFSVSRAGVLAYRPGANSGGALQITWFDRQGKPEGTFGQPGSDRGLALSPDGTHAAGRDQAQTASGDIWLLDFTRGVRTRLTFRQSPGSLPVWSPDGSGIIFAAGNTADTIYGKAASGAGDEKELLKTNETKAPTSVSPDARFLLYQTASVPGRGNDLWILPLDGSRKPALLLGTPFNEWLGSFSPDGRWIAYLSDDSGRPEVYVRPFVASGPSLGEGKWQVSRDGAVAERIQWRSDGKEIFFMGRGDGMMAVEVNGSGGAFQMGTPQQLFQAAPHVGWDVTGDGKRFLLAIQPGQAGQTPITVVLNWQADLKR